MSGPAYASAQALVEMGEALTMATVTAKAADAAAKATGAAFAKESADVLKAAAAAHTAAAAYEKMWGAQRQVASAKAPTAFMDGLLSMKNGPKSGSGASGQISDYAKLTQFIGTNFGPKAVSVFHSVSGAIAENSGLLDGLGSSLAGAAGIAIQAAKAAAVLATAIAGIAIAASKEIFDATKFKDDAMDGFNAVLGSTAMAQKAYDKAAQTSLDVAGNLHDTMDQMNSLISNGFSVDMADQVIRGMADIKAMDPKADVEKISAALEQVHAKGGLAEKTLKSVALASHTTVQDITAALMTDLGKTKVQVEDMLKKGTITADQGTRAVLEAISKKTGKPLGGAAAEANDDVYGMIERLKNLKEQMLASVNVDWSPLKDSLKNVFDVLSGPQGAALIQVIGESLSKLVKGAFGDISGPDGPAKIEAGFKTAANLIRDLTNVLLALVDAGKWVVGAIESIDQSVSSANRELEQMGGFGTTLKAMFLGMLDIMDPVNAAVDALGGIGGRASSMAQTIGAAVIRGIVNGITGGLSDVIEAVVDVAQAAIAAAKSEFGIKSPSTVFHEIGTMNMRGLVQGQDSEQANVERRTASTIDPSRVGMQAGQSIRNSSSSSSRSFAGNVVQNFYGSKGSSATEMEDTLRSMNNSHA